ncbi:hypothetical protein SSX86_015954 [Deinandra increscens subsp. villosa]|uniref:Auxin-responsive protein n=1 Tax=Deinandra increscens subsp. villosa TaxID=3103831 RepID=A0AAP0GXY4_9ASTR
MTSDSSSTYLLNHADLHSLYYQTNNQNRGIIDLGLSLRVMPQPPTYDHSENLHDDYRDLVEWDQLHPYECPRNGVMCRGKTSDNIVDEKNMFQRSKRRSEFVKVNMDGELIGRKIGVLHHSSYSSLATKLEDMFGKQQSLCSLRLLESGSEFSLWYKDGDEQWRIVGDVPWKEFVESVTRIRIMLKDETFFRSMSTMV